MERTCNKCGVSKELNEDNFYTNKTIPGGFTYECKPCRRALSNERHKQNREFNLARMKEYNNNRRTNYSKRKYMPMFPDQALKFLTCKHPYPPEIINALGRGDYLGRVHMGESKRDDRMEVSQ